MDCEKGNLGVQGQGYQCEGGIIYKNSTTNASKMQTRVARVKVKGGSNKVSDKTARVASVKGNIWDTAKDICMKDRVGRLQGLPI